MDNLCFGMKHINITQLPRGSYSHANLAVDLGGKDAGIDEWYARGETYWKCTTCYYSGSNTFHFLSCDKNGKPVQVHCADGKNRIITLSLTHDNMSPTIGKLYHDEVMFHEGTKYPRPGVVTGNHIHLEVAEGDIRTRFLDKNTGIWTLYNELNPIDVMFVDTSFSRILNTRGAVLRTCKSITYRKGEHDMIFIEDGFQYMTYNGQEILVYKQKDGQDIGMVSAGTDGHTVAPIKDIDDDRVHFCKINASYFQMATDASDPYGSVYGVVQSFNYEQEPRQGKFWVYYVLRSNETGYCMDNDYWLVPGDVKFAVSPAAVMMYGGEKVRLLSPAISESKLTKKAAHTMLLRLNDGRFVLAVVKGGMDASECMEWAETIGAVDMILLDGGGSSQMHWEGGLYSTGREIPNVITLYREGHDYDPAPANETAGPEIPENATIITETENGSGKIDWAQKLSSRKLWVAIAGIVAGIMILLGYGDKAESVEGLILTLGSIFAYIFGEAWTDVARVKNDNGN